MIEKDGKAFLFRHGFFEDDFLALKIEGGDEYAFLVNEKKYDENLNSVLLIHTFLTKKYIESPVRLSQDGYNESFTLIVTILMVLLFIVLIIGWATES